MCVLNKYQVILLTLKAQKHIQVSFEYYDTVILFNGKRLAFQCKTKTKQNKKTSAVECVFWYIILKYNPVPLECDT